MFSPRLRKRGRSASTSPPARPHATPASPSSSSCSSVEVAFRRHASSSGEGILPLHPLSKTSPTTLNTKARTGKKNRTKTEPPPLLGNSTKGGSFRLRKNVSIDPSCLVEPPAQPGGDAPLLIAATPPPKRPPLTISQQRQQQPAQQRPKQSTVPMPQSPTTPVLLPPLSLPSQTPPQTPSPLSSRKGFVRDTLPGTVRPHSMGNLHKLKFQEVLHSVATSPQVVTNSAQSVSLSSVRQEQQQTSSRKAATNKKKKKKKSGSKILPAGQYAMQRNPTTGDLYYVYSPSPLLPLASDAFQASSTEPRDVPKDRLSYSGILQSATSQFISAEEGIEPIPSNANELCEETALHLPLTESFASVLTSYALSVNSSEPASARSSKRGSIKRQSSSFFYDAWSSPSENTSSSSETDSDEDFMLDPSWVVDEDELAFRQLQEQEKEREIEKERELQRLLRLSVGLKPKLDKQKTVEEENKAQRGKHSASNEVKVVNPLYAKNLHKRVASMDTHNSHSSDADLEHSSRSSSSDTRHVRVCIEEVSRGRSRTRNEIGKYGSLRERGFSTVKCEPEEERRIDREEYNALFSASSHVTSLTRTNTGRSRSLSPGRKRDKIPRQENEQQKWGKKKKKKKKNRTPHGIQHKSYNYKEPRNSWKEAATSLWLIEHEPPLAGVKTHDGVFVDQQINREWKGTRKEKIRKQEYVENEEEKIKEEEEEEEEEKEEEGEDDFVSAAILLKKYFPSNSPRQHLVNNSSDGVDVTKRDTKSDAVTKQDHSCRKEADQELSLEVSGRSESACISITCSSVTVDHSGNLNEYTNHSRNTQSLFSETLTHAQIELGAEQLADWRQKEQQWHKEKKEMEARISKIRLKYLALKEKCREMKDTDDDTRPTTVVMQEDCTVVISNGHSEKELSKPDCSHCQEKDETIQKLLALFAELNCINAKAQELVRNKDSEHSCE
ncbi:Ubiquitin carboxyl-terminal hydrolase [Balamuthia mandrillaris]